MWSTLKNIQKFTRKSDLDAIIGKPQFQIEGRPVYYYGGGIAVYFSPRCFRIEGIQRVEYGEVDEYAVGLYHFSDVGGLKTCLGLDSFPADDVAPLEDDVLDGAITYHSTFSDIHRKAVKNHLEDYREGETQRMVDGKFGFLNRFIQCGQYELFFYGKSKRTKLSGFQYVFRE